MNCFVSFFTAVDGTSFTSWTSVPQLGDALPLVPSDPRWIEVALADLDAVHADHLHCERKAAQSALSLIRSYPERADLSTAMARLAHDETRHVIQVAQLMARREQPARVRLRRRLRRGAARAHPQARARRGCSIGCSCSR